MKRPVLVLLGSGVAWIAVPSAGNIVSPGLMKLRADWAAIRQCSRASIWPSLLDSDSDSDPDPDEDEDEEER